MKFFAVFCLVVSILAVTASESSEEAPKHKKRTPRIIQGWHAIPGQFPHQAMVTSRYEAGHSSACGGSLISDRWILTAAHCLHGTAETHIYLGSINYPKSPVKINTRISYSHPDFDPDTYNNDIGLIDLDQSVNFTDNIQPIRILANPNESYVGQIGVVSGFGYITDIGVMNPLLSFVNLTIISNDECAETYESELIIPSTICGVGILSGAQGTCNGDSGGPMILQGEEENTLIGIASFISKSGCSSSFPSGFVRPSFYTEWITSITGIEF